MVRTAADQPLPSVPVQGGTLGHGVFMTVTSFSQETALAVAEAARPWLDKNAGEPPPAAAIVAALRAAEADHGGRQRDLWGHAAGNAACAMSSESDHGARWLWATALDYVRLAAATEEGPVPHPGGTHAAHGLGTGTAVNAKPVEGGPAWVGSRL
ncbi:hypothetical protein K388_07303 [Streptomyces sp. KhCrAH-43]|nr:hypothetical protein K388_07303 [Streptomyces sp. KhCrAH-43]